jgi:SAM-dependent methyltransferase
MKISPEIQRKLKCPVTKGSLKLNGDLFKSEQDLFITYPVIEGIPVLINEGNSLFEINDFRVKANTTFELDETKFRKVIKRLMPKITHNLNSKNNYNYIKASLAPRSKVLVIGGSIVGQGMTEFYDNPSYEIVGTDVSFGPHTKIICDAHDLPFEDDSFDCVIAQAVMEHVLDPARCADEIFRVVKTGGIVYAETPFIQQVHMRQYDFTRFTHLGHRRLFRKFEEIKSGPTGGPGMALAWSYTWFLRSFSNTAFFVYLLTFLGYITSFFLKYFDYFLIHKPGGYDAASQFYFMGKKTGVVLTDRELIKQFRGIHHKF